MAFQNFSEKICFVGHSHVPFHVFVNGEESEIHIEPSETVELKKGFRYLSNVGSVGQPRDGDPRGCYVILDREHEILERFRVAYDVERAAAKILEAGLPEFLANRLSRGR
jgi:diadenosine tetraphosphatase ApaH/serine/threonine PP2A family protein phosphatase